MTWYRALRSTYHSQPLSRREEPIQRIKGWAGPREGKRTPVPMKISDTHPPFTNNTEMEIGSSEFWLGWV